jgi:predicted Fe-S protein YdhL (DUF1289 family)
LLCRFSSACLRHLRERTIDWDSMTLEEQEAFMHQKLQERKGKS